MKLFLALNSWDGDTDYQVEMNQIVMIKNTYEDIQKKTSYPFIKEIMLVFYLAHLEQLSNSVWCEEQGSVSLH
jgi:hypothetical protein